jgi:hypothetical protein
MVLPGVPGVLGCRKMREIFVRHFDVVVVVWVLALAVAWSALALSRAQLTTDQWSSQPQNGPAWVVPG